jgi:hypothetical protein
MTAAMVGLVAAPFESYGHALGYETTVMSGRWHGGHPGPNYVVGPVIARAPSLHISFFDRPSIRTSTIAPPPTSELDRRIRFFVVILPCPATPRRIVARNATGRVVAQLVTARPHGSRAPC